MIELRRRLSFANITRRSRFRGCAERRAYARSLPRNSGRTGCGGVARLRIARPMDARA
jgi:hypothetical protein